MRLWDYRLLKVLPDKMLVSQWRECIAIKRQWEKGTLKHRLVSYVMKYDKFLFRNYCNKVYEEMKKRNINCSFKIHQELDKFGEISGYKLLTLDIIAYPEHNDRYLKQCYYNLQEKYDRGIITKDEWEKVKSCPDLYDIDVYDGDF